MIGGMLGFASDVGNASVDDVTIRSWNSSNSSFDVVEHVETFTLDGNGRSGNDPAQDLAGNMTFDGTQRLGFNHFDLCPIAPMSNS